MSIKKSALSRGLQDLLSHDLKASVLQPAAPIKNTNAPLIQEVPVEYLHRAPFQPRRTFEPHALTELAESIRAQGILQPIIVRHHASSEGFAKEFEIIAGERRWRAAQQAGLAMVPVMIREVDDKTAMALALIENVQRQDLTPIDEALAFQKLIHEHGLNQQELAEMVGKSRTVITNLIRLLNLEPEVQKLLNDKQLEVGHAKVLLALTGSQQKQAAHTVHEKQLSVRATEQLVKHLLREKKPVLHIHSDPDTLRLQQQLSETLGAAVNIRNLGNGKGELVIKYHTLNELSGILEHIR